MRMSMTIAGGTIGALITQGLSRVPDRRALLERCSDITLVAALALVGVALPIFH